MPIITLTTDFGTSDGYVGAIKGVIATVVATTQGGGKPMPVTMVDLAHDIPRGDIAHGAWVVATGTREFPDGTIHLVVVDPGVGGARMPIVAEVGAHLYIGPDNGVFSYLAIDRARRIDNHNLMAPNISPSFHGRDIFAPVAAYLATGTALADVGFSVDVVGKLPWGPRPAGEGRVVHIDHYGNLITDLPAAEAGEAITIAGRRLAIVKTYADVPKSELLAYVGSSRTIEIAVRDGRADRVLQAERGMRIAPVPPPTAEYR
jgi:S-adenosyl-L-methionine hydrolase (adenosine-forming)